MPAILFVALLAPAGYDDDARAALSLIMARRTAPVEPATPCPCSSGCTCGCVETGNCTCG